MAPKINNKILKNYFKCSKRYQRVNRSKIRSILQEFCSKIGLKVDNIILSRRKKNAGVLQKPPKLTILKKQISKSQMAYQCMKATDLLNISNKKYSLLRKLLKNINPFFLPSKHWINEMKFDLNNFFEIIPNDKGFYVNPEQKIQFVCKKFLINNPDYQKQTFRIKLSADVTQISKTRIQLLNFTFDLLDDNNNISSVMSIFVLGILNYFHIKFDHYSYSNENVTLLLNLANFCEAFAKICENLGILAKICKLKNYLTSQISSF
jgi:hypothetical protein